MSTVLSIVVLLASVLLIFVVYIQNPKGGGLSSDFASPGQLGGVKRTNEFIDKLTWSLAGVIVVASIIITMQQPKPKKAQNPAKANTEQPAQSNQKSK
jgi:preprotein translocase subunit SecG